MKQNQRRDFLKHVASGAAVLGAGLIANPFQAAAGGLYEPGINEAEDWFKKINGKHRIVFDVTEPHNIFPFAWPRVFLLTNQKTGSAEKDCSVVVILRHNAIPYALQSNLWEKYKLGEVFKIDDPKTKSPATRNAFWQPAVGDFKLPGLGNVPIGINELQASGVMFGVCDAAMTVYSAAVADAIHGDAVEIKNDWVNGLLPGIQSMPSGVWAVGRAQEHGCSYCFVG
ncbi:MAG: twin-arginine translocation signal domain-containing protein [Bacteroidota bacterium]